MDQRSGAQCQKKLATTIVVMLENTKNTKERGRLKRMPSDELKPRKSTRKLRNGSLPVLEDSPVDFQADSLVVCQGECPVVSLEVCPVAWEVCPVVWAACPVAWAVCLVVCPVAWVEECPVVCPEVCPVEWVEQQGVCRILMPFSKTRNLWRQCRTLLSWQPFKMSARTQKIWTNTKTILRSRKSLKSCRISLEVLDHLNFAVLIVDVFSLYTFLVNAFLGHII